MRDREKREGIECWEGRRERRRCGKGSRERWDREGEEMGSLPALGLAGEWALGGRPSIEGLRLGGGRRLGLEGEWACCSLSLLSDLL